MTDDEALDAFQLLARTEGILPALESAHAVAYAAKLAPAMGSDQIMIINISGRGDKDVPSIARILEVKVEMSNQASAGSNGRERAVDTGLRRETALPDGRNRIDAAFDRLRREGRKGLIAYITAGDPSYEATADLVLALERAGADLIELGVPFSDPMADGPVIQQASMRALAGGTTLAGILGLVRRLRREAGHADPPAADDLLQPGAALWPGGFCGRCGHGWCGRADRPRPAGGGERAAAGGAAAGPDSPDPLCRSHQHPGAPGPDRRCGVQPNPERPGASSTASP